MNFTKTEIIKEIGDLSIQEKKFVPGETVVPVSGAVITEQDILTVVKAVLSGWFTEGRWTHEFSKSLRQSFAPSARFALPTTSGSSANLLAICAITQKEFGSKALRPGDEVITSAVGFPTTVSAILQAGLVPVFVDPDFPTYNPSVDTVSDAITDKTRAIFMAHTLGNPFDFEKMRQLADEEGMWLLEDNCDALGSTLGGVSTGVVGDISTLSFFPAHHITSGEGGAVVTNSPMIAKVVNSLREWGKSCDCEPGQDNKCGLRHSQPKIAGLPAGFDHKYQFGRLGYNLKWTDMQAALALSQIGRLDEFGAARKRNWKLLHDGMRSFTDCFILPEPTKNSDPSWFGFCLTLSKSAPFLRSEIVDYLEQHKIRTRMLFGGNLLRQPGFQNIPHRTIGKLYNADVVTTDTFWVGVSPNITPEMIAYELQVFEDFVKSKRMR